MKISAYPILKIENVSKTIEGKLLFQNVNLTLDKGDICCLYGENGSGKSVFIDCMLGFQPIDEGEINYNGIPIRGRENLKRDTGIVSIDHQAFLENLSPREYFDLTIDVFGIKNDEDLERLQQLIERFNISEFIDTTFNDLSFGSKKKVQFIGNVIYNPTLLVCDEIFEGLDETGVEEVKRIFSERAEDSLVTFYTTHISQESKGISNKEIFLKNKQVLINGDLR
ncbi:ATP-binding cassette domain-containing protein [Bacillus weihaiensis]|uniref:ATP-binding cassette domain-containing protein n=1 Tax=Bacillus weihaiensis TaxID=1547283 RepID=UPI002356A16A|nr:ABC transporter ATP-binding protein [Bacillus weihaiensis]